MDIVLWFFSGLGGALIGSWIAFRQRERHFQVSIQPRATIGHDPSSGLPHIVNESGNYLVLRAGVAWRRGDRSKLARLPIEGISVPGGGRHPLYELSKWSDPETDIDYWLQYDDPAGKRCHSFSIRERGGVHHERGNFRASEYEANVDPGMI